MGHAGQRRSRDPVQPSRHHPAGSRSLQREQLGLTDEQLLERIAEFDAADGNADGRYTPRTTCASCGATTKAGAQCHFCGETAGGTDPFSGL